MTGTAAELLTGLFPTALHLAAALAWLVFGAVWIAGAAWTSRATKRISWLRSAVDGLIYLVAFALLFAPPPWTGILWSPPLAIRLLLFTLELLAFVFALWARVHLGRLWSVVITLRTGHKVVRTGPYRIVRHPVYTGFITAAWMFALLTASPTALSGAALLTIEMAWKAKREERFLRRELGAMEFDEYATTTPMLIPRRVR